MTTETTYGWAIDRDGQLYLWRRTDRLEDGVIADRDYAHYSTGIIVEGDEPSDDDLADATYAAALDEWDDITDWDYWTPMVAADSDDRSMGIFGWDQRTGRWR